MGDKVPSGDAKARNLGKAQEELLALFQQDAARLQTHRNETPPARVERAKLIQQIKGYQRQRSFQEQQLLNLFDESHPQPSSYSKAIGERLFAYHAERLEKSGREVLKQLIYPTRADLEALPEKVLIPRKWASRTWSYSDVEEDMFKLTWNLVRLMDSDFGHIDAVRRAFCAPGGLSILNGKNETGKTTVAVLQALQAALCGHKVLITGPTKSDVNAISNRLLDILRRMDTIAIRDNHKNPKLKVYLATSIWEDVPSTDDLLAELISAHKRAVFRENTPAAVLTNRLGPHSLFHQLSIDLDDELRRRSGAKDVRQCRAFPQSLDVPLICNAFTEYLNSGKFEALDSLRAGLDSVLERVLARANIVVTSCLAAGNTPFFDPTVVIVDQWNTDKDLECMIPLTAFDRTEFRSIIGNFDIPHWRRMWEWNFPIALPVHFSVVLDTHQPFTSMYTLKRRISNGMMNVQSQKRSENVSLAPELETEKTKEAWIDYCTAYIGYWWNG